MSIVPFDNIPITCHIAHTAALWKWHFVIHIFLSARKKNVRLKYFSQESIKEKSEKKFHDEYPSNAIMGTGMCGECV
jgi:hypothetical protein